MTRQLLGIDIGGTKCAAVLGRSAPERPEILGRSAFETRVERGPDAILAELVETARGLLQKHAVDATSLAGIGISCGGPLDSAKGIVLGPPNLPRWDKIPVVDRFRKALGVPARLQNDADACALAEWRWGAGRGCRHMVFLTFGTGMGAGLILNGQLYSGANDLAGEVGHIRLAEEGPLGHGKRGSFEGFASGGGISQLARERRLKTTDVRELSEAARAGDRAAREVFETSGRYLGRGLAMLIDALNPERIVIGGVFMRAEDLLRPAAEAEIRREALGFSARTCKILPAALGEAIGDYAALSVAASLAETR